ncbi:MAG: hypothetical protein KKA64_01240 [Nanoarchaeota archaeon]|nr:hypothetical protein [Nanoarchaeota archaeon]
MTETKPINQIIEEISPYYQGKKDEEKSEDKHTLVYNSSAEMIEPLYFFVLDLLNDFGLTPEKLVDNFTSSVGGAYFSETQLKAGRLQDEANKILASAGIIAKGILQNVYDLKDFKIRIESYNNLSSKDRNVREAAKLSLKQVWMDKVDISKGNASIKVMAMQIGFQTLLHAFLAVDTEKDAEKLDLNNAVKRIIKPRIQEFNIWLEQSEKELRTRYEMQKNYLKSQVNNLKLYSRWVRPYLEAASKLEMEKRERSPDLVTLFNTIVIGVTLLGKTKLKIGESALAGELPLDFKKLKPKRDYYSCILVDFKFRTFPRQGTFVGKSEITFRAYALNQEELDKLNQELEKSDISEMMRIIGGVTGESLDILTKDVESFLKEEDETKKQSKPKDESNPFLALTGFYGERKTAVKKEGTKEKTEITVKKEDFIEREHLRKVSAEKAAEMCFKLFDIYKKAHGMPSWT